MTDTDKVSIPVLEFTVPEGRKAQVLAAIRMILEDVRRGCPVDTGALQKSLEAVITVS